MIPAIAISGTPGTGKTVVGRLLAKHLAANILELGPLIKTQQLLLGEDLKRETLVADIEKLKKFITKLLQDASTQHIVVGHFSDEVPTDLLEFLVVLRCHPVTLTQRLRSRQWPSKKILENVQAEILGECTTQGLARHDRNKIFEIDTTDTSIEEVVEGIESILAGNRKEFLIGQISWLRSLDSELLHQIMEKGTLPSNTQKA